MDFSGRTSGGFRRRLASTTDTARTAASLLHADPLGGHGALATSDPTDLDTPLHCEGEWTSDVPIAMGPTIHFTTPSGIDLVNPELLRDFLSTEERRHPLVVAAIEIAWHFELALPEGYTLDALPAGRSVATPAGRFESRYRATDDGRLVVERLLRVERDRYAPEQYPELRAVLLEAIVDLETILTAGVRG
jgi:hypothetical protein